MTMVNLFDADPDEELKGWDRPETGDMVSNAPRYIVSHHEPKERKRRRSKEVKYSAVEKETRNAKVKLKPIRRKAEKVDFRTVEDKAQMNVDHSEKQDADEEYTPYRFQEMANLEKPSISDEKSFRIKERDTILPKPSARPVLLQAMVSPSRKSLLSTMSESGPIGHSMYKGDNAHYFPTFNPNENPIEHGYRALNSILQENTTEMFDHRRLNGAHQTSKVPHKDNLKVRKLPKLMKPLKHKTYARSSIQVSTNASSLRIFYQKKRGQR